MPRTVLRTIVTLFALGAAWSAVADSQNLVERGEPSPPSFREIWAYLMQGEEKDFTGGEPVTDVCWFSAGLSRNGRLVGQGHRPVIAMANGKQPRVHLVVAELSNDALMHFALDPAFGVRPLLVEDICKAAEEFDGIQIDFEAVARDDAEIFRAFIAELKARLPAGKLLSVAVPARMKLTEDAYEYSRLAAVADRLIVMAYDEHWSTSAPGPVASLSWCARVADYARGVVPADRLVVGLPLYGRAWQDKRLSRALRYKNVQDLLAEKNSTASYAPETGASFEYTESVIVKVFFDDERSLGDKLRLYRDRGIGAVSFWRIGLGPVALWDGLKLDAGGGSTQDSGGTQGDPPRILPPPDRNG